MKRGITRAEEHIMAKKGNDATCTETPKNVREELWNYLKKKQPPLHQSYV